MAVSNIKLTVDKTNVDAGSSVVRFTITWEGDTDYKDWVGDGLNIRGVGGFKGIDVNNLYGKNGWVQFTKTIPANWKGDVTGGFVLSWFDRSENVTTVTGSSNDVTLNVKARELDFQVSLNPSNPTIKPGDTAVFQPIITGVDMPYEAHYKWTYKTAPIGTDEPLLKIPYSTPGYEFVRCEVTITKDGYPDAKTVVGDTKLTMAKGTLQDVAFMITKIPVDLPVFAHDDVECKVTGAPTNATTHYEWTANGVKFGTTARSTFKPVKPGEYDIMCTISVSSPDYNAVTISTPLMRTNVLKLTPDDLTISAYSMGNTSIGMGPATDFSIVANRPDVQYGSVPVSPSAISARVDNGTELTEFKDWTDYCLVTGKDKLNLLADIGNHELRYTMTFPETEYVSAGTTRELTHSFGIGKTSNWQTSGNFLIDGVPLVYPNILNVKAAPSETINIAVQNLIYSDYSTGSAAYKADLDDIAKSGKYELINYLGDVEVTAVDGVFTYTVPDEIKSLKGKLRHTVSRDDYFTTSPLVAEIDIQIDIVSNPMDPMPTVSISQTPNPVVLGKKATLSRTFTDLPVGADTTETYWFLNEVANGSAETSEVTASKGDMIRNNTFVKANGFDQALIGQDYAINVESKPWPVITLDLMPARTTVPWGEFLIAGFDIIGEEAVEDQAKLSFGKMHWFLDGNLIETLAGDDSLTIRATHPGAHTIRGETDLYHPDYVDGRLTISKTFNMTTEPRDMATVLTLLPTSASVEKWTTQKFTATVTGAPADATTEYKWEVDGVVQASTVNYLDYTASAVGKNTIKVTSTTKAQDAEDDVQTATAELTVTTITQATTASISPATQTINQDTSYNATVNVEDAPINSTITYLWSTGETTQSVSKKATKSGTINLTCKVTVKATDYTDKVIDTATATVNVTQIAVPGFVASVSSDKSTVEVGESYMVSVSTSASPTSGNRFTYLWNTGETTMTINKVGVSAGVVTHSCDVKVENPDYLTNTKNVTVNVEVEDNTPVIPTDCEAQYVHPLPHRNSAFIWAGWWVMNEIEYATANSIDWTHPESTDLKFKKELRTIAKMMLAFPKLEVQESRDGRIINRELLEEGKIYRKGFGPVPVSRN